MSTPYRSRLSRQEINRKLLHLVALLMPAGIFYLPRMTDMPASGPPTILGALLLLSILVEVLRFRIPAIQERYGSTFGALLRKEESRRITGSTYIIGAAFLCALIFMDCPHIAFMALTAFTLGDAGAALVGIGIGRYRLGAKTLEGTLACFFVCLVVFSVYPHLPYLLDAWGGAMPAGIQLGAPVGIALLELVPLRFGRFSAINDNLVGPVLAGFLIQVLHRLLG